MRVLVALLVGTVSLAAPAAAQNPIGVDTIFLGGPIVTIDDERPEVEAVAIDGGRIVALGSEEEVLERRGLFTEVVDLEGKAVMPGLVEAHCHPLETSLFGQTVDVSGFTHDTRASVMKALRNAVAEASKGEWVLATGWDPVLVEDLGPPTLAELDAIAPETPVFVLGQMLHDGYANSAAFEAAGIDRDTPDPPGDGSFGRDENGDLDGHVYEVSALERITAAMPKPPPSAVTFLLERQLAAYARAGYTTLSVPGALTGEDPVGHFARLGDALDPRVRTFLYVTTAQAESGALDVRAASSRFAVKGVKVWLDGSPYTGGAAFADPYLDTAVTRRIGLELDHRGGVNYTLDELVALLAPYHERGRQLAMHAQGEVAIDLALDTVEALLERHPREDHRHRIEHAATITRGQLERARSLGVTVTFFVDHVWFYGHALPDIVGEERAERFMPMASALATGHTVSLHTDNPATPVDPFRALHTAVTRTTRRGGDVLGPDERVSVDAALEAITLGAAWQLFEETERGSLEVGKVADLVVLSENPRTVPSERLADIRVVGTWLDGEKVGTSAWSWTTIALGADLAWDLLLSWLP